MDKTQNYIRNLKMEEVPWHRLATAYGRASDFPEYLNTIWAMADFASTETALNEIMDVTEHQGTLWHSTPFAMIFLVRAFEHAIPETGKNECADFIIGNLLDFFELIAECFYDYEEMMLEDEPEEPLPDFSDMLQEKFLWPDVYDEDEDIAWSEDEDFCPDDLIYSIWYYSYQVLLECKPLLEKLENTPFHTRAEEMIELLTDKDE